MLIVRWRPFISVVARFWIIIVNEMIPINVGWTFWIKSHCLHRRCCGRVNGGDVGTVNVCPEVNILEGVDSGSVWGSEITVSKEKHCLRKVLLVFVSVSCTCYPDAVGHVRHEGSGGAEHTGRVCKRKARGRSTKVWPKVGIAAN